MNTVHCLSTLPATDGNFLSALKRASIEECKQAINIMKNSAGQHKGRIAACEKQIRKMEKTLKRTYNNCRALE